MVGDLTTHLAGLHPQPQAPPSATVDDGVGGDLVNDEHQQIRNPPQGVGLGDRRDNAPQLPQTTQVERDRYLSGRMAPRNPASRLGNHGRPIITVSPGIDTPYRPNRMAGERTQPHPGS